MGEKREMELNNLAKGEEVDYQNISIHQCARDGDEASMARLLALMTGNVIKKVNAHDDNHLSALHYAARCNYAEIVRMLVDKGADVTNRGDEDATPLHFAARYRRIKVTKSRLAAANDDDDDEGEGTDGGTDTEGEGEDSVVTYLVAQGCDVNTQDKYGLTPLHFAATRGNDIAAKELLKCQGIDVEARDKQRMTALHMAAIHGNPEIAFMLMAAGASIRCMDEDSCTPLHHACAEGSYDIAVMLFKKGRNSKWGTVKDMVTDRDIDGNSCLHHSVDNGHYRLTQLCLAKNADVNTPRIKHNYPLHLAAVAANIDIVKLLISKGAKIDVLNESMETPLHRAAAFDHVEVLEYLMRSGAKVDCRDRDNYTPLLLASVYGHVGSVAVLLQMGANLAATDKSDKTAVFLAAEENRLDMLKELLKHPEAAKLLGESDRYGNEPIHVSAENGLLSIVKCLIEAGASFEVKNEMEQTPLHLAAMHGCTNVVREIVKSEKNVVNVINDEDEDCNTPLHLAALHGHKKAAKALLEAGADVDARNTMLWTPLDCAAARGFTKTAKVLLEEESPVDPVDKSKTTPLHLACINGHLGVARLLLDFNADITYLDHDGNNCLDLAVEHNHEDVAMAIVKSSRWEEALTNENLSLKTGFRMTPMRRLIVKMPTVAEYVFNQCTTGSKHNPDDQDYTIFFNYTYLDDTYSEWRNINDRGSSSDPLCHARLRFQRTSQFQTSEVTSNAQIQGSVYGEDGKVLPHALPYSSDSGVLKINHPLFIMVKSKREDLLMHPLVTSLLHNKWTSFGRYVYYGNLAIYSVFLTFLTGYMTLTKPPYFFNSTVTETTPCNSTLIDATQPMFPRIAKYAVIILVVYNVLREFAQIVQTRMNYFGFENLVEWVTYVTSFIYVVDLDECQRLTGYRYPWQWQVGAVCIFLAWMNLVLLIQKFPRFGIYIVMFTDILLTFLQFSIVFFLFVIAFGLSFHALLQNQIEFESVVGSFIKTAVMMIGEFDFADIFHSPTNYFRHLSLALFVAFIILMSIIIMNLLVGLAVDDIKAVQEQAVLKRLAMRVDLALGVESVLPHILRRKFVVNVEKFYPNALRENWFKRVFHIGKTNLSQAAIEKALYPDSAGTAKLERDRRQTRDDIKKLQRSVKDLESYSSRIESMVTALVEERGLSWEEEDEREANE